MRDRRLDSKAWRVVRLVVLRRDSYQCQIRGPHCTHEATQVDHIHARVEGGDCFDTANLRAACRPCNSAGGGALTKALRAGGLIGKTSRQW
jgi:5-methylcytosine-specific restriction endonuclease McrA